MKLKGPLYLLTAALIWGSSFIVMKNAVDFITPAILLLIRFIIASFILSMLFFKQIISFSKDKIIGCLLTGFCLYIAYYVQTWGLAYTTPGKNAFLTAVYCAIVPFLSWLIDQQRPSLYHFIAAFICVLGIGFVSLDNFSIQIGDLLTLIAGFLYAIHIMMTQHFSKDVDGKAFTTFQFYGATLLAFVFSLFFEDLSIIKTIQPTIFLQIFYLAFFATAITMLCQTLGQKYTNECYASLILSLESVFGVIFSIIFYHEVLTLKMFIGFTFIFIAIVISQTQLSFLRRSA
ncbi:MAG: DMT family transporter [Erysipelotrichaceae bacterium]|nr:DMT family transporter [Erysipelotrichaceae bacterium]